MKGLLITATDGKKTFIPDSMVLEILAGATGVITDVKYMKNDGTAAATSVNSIAVWVPGTNIRYEYGCMAPDGRMQSHLKNYN